MVIRSAASLSATAPRAADTSTVIAPPSTTIPSGAPREAAHGGKRCSSGRIKALPSGDSPATARSAMLVTTSQLARRVNRVHRRIRPAMPIEIRILDGSAKKPSILERMKNTRSPPALTVAPRACSQVAQYLAARLAPRRVARLGVVIRRIKAGQLHALLDFAEYPALVELVLGAFVGDEIHHGLRNDDGAVVIGDDHIARKDGTAAAADRLLPADECQSVDGSRRRDPCAPHRQRAGQDAGAGAHCARGGRGRTAWPPAITPSGISSMAARVEIGLAQLSGVARSSRTGTKRNVKAGPIMRSPLGTSGFGPFIQQRRMPFLSSIVVIVAVVTLRRTPNKASFIARLAERNSCRVDAESLVAAAQPCHEGNRQKHHPGLADDLPGP